MSKPKIRIYSLGLLFVLTIFYSYSFSQEQTEPGYVVVTASDPQIPVEDLELLLKPLIRDELIAETEAWLQLLKDKVSQISTAEIQMRQKTREIDQKEEQIDKTIEELEETEQQIKDPAETATQTSESEPPTEVARKTEAEIQGKVEALNQVETDIQKIAAQAKTDLDATKAEAELTRSEEDLIKKSEDALAASNKIQDTVAEIAQSDLESQERCNKSVQPNSNWTPKLKNNCSPISLNFAKKEPP